jgi:eukaryotic-like serine/threonine-protein kinase
MFTSGLLPLNSIIGRYQLTDFLGAGGMGEVYRARHTDTGESYAIKALTQAPWGTTSLARFQNEAIIQYNLDHPHIARVFEYIELQGLPCLVMEYVDGCTLYDRIRQSGPFVSDEVLCPFRQLVDAVAYMHSRGVVHRDIKSTNIKISLTGVIKLLDFGIAFWSGTPGLTRPGHLIGTLENLAPEQVLGGKGDARSDVWALGVLLYEMVTGRLPFEAEAPEILAERILTATYNPPSGLVPSVPAHLEHLIDRCLRPKPADRFQSAMELRVIIECPGFAFDSPWEASERCLRRLVGGLRRRWAWVGGGVVVLLCLISSRWMFQAEDTPTTSPPTAAVDLIAPPQPAIAPVEPKAQQPKPQEPKTNLLPVPHKGVTGFVEAAPSPPRPPRELRSILLRTSEGVAEVYQSNVLLGITPLSITAEFGKELDFVFRREGYSERAVHIRVDNKSEHTISMVKQ